MDDTNRGRGKGAQRRIRSGCLLKLIRFIVKIAKSSQILFMVLESGERVESVIYMPRLNLYEENIYPT